MSTRTYLVCDHKGCDQTMPYVYNKTKFRGTGWTLDGQKVAANSTTYCPEHSVIRMRKCTQCGERMRAWNRTIEEFPTTVATGKDASRCSNCGPMTTRQREIELDRAVENYYNYRPWAKPYIADNEGAIAAIWRHHADDIRGIVGV